MKISTHYEVWAGDDLVEDSLNYEQARLLAKREMEEYPDVEVVIDEITHYTITSEDDLAELDDLL